MKKVAAKAKIGKVMKEFKEGSLKSSSGSKVTGKKQALAIAMSKAGKSKPAKKAAASKKGAPKLAQQSAFSGMTGGNTKGKAKNFTKKGKK